MVELCRERGIRAVALEVPRTDETTTDAEKRAMYVGWAKDAGFSVLSLGGAYGSHPLDSISISRNDRHPSVLGHRLLAERFFTLLRENDESLQLGLARSR